MRRSQRGMNTSLRLPTLLSLCLCSVLTASHPRGQLGLAYLYSTDYILAQENL